jgi:hypothetical protein
MVGIITLRAPRNCSKHRSSTRRTKVVLNDIRGLRLERPQTVPRAGRHRREECSRTDIGVDGAYQNRWTAWQTWRMAAPLVSEDLWADVA